MGSTDRSRLHRFEREALAGKVRLLKDRVARGRLDPERLELAAYLGDPGACAAVDQDPAEAEGTELELWLLGIDRWGWEAQARVSFAAVRYLLPVFAGARPRDRRLEQAVSAAERWLGSQSDRAAQAASQGSQGADAAAGELRAELDELESGSGERSDALIGALAVAEAVAVVTEVVLGDPASYSRYAPVAAQAVIDWEHKVPGDVRQALRQTLVPWALG